LPLSLIVYECNASVQGVLCVFALLYNRGQFWRGFAFLEKSCSAISRFWRCYRTCLQVNAILLHGVGSNLLLFLFDDCMTTCIEIYLQTYLLDPGHRETSTSISDLRLPGPSVSQPRWIHATPALQTGFHENAHVNHSCVVRVWGQFKGIQLTWIADGRLYLK
jgi:hypothetical protein